MGKPVAVDDEFGFVPVKQTERPSVGWRWARSFAWIGASLYVPFCWIALARPSLSRFSWSELVRYWLIMPGFVPGVVLFHPNDRLEWTAWIVTTVGMVLGLTWLGSLGPRRLMLAVVLALLIAIPSSLVSYGLIVLN